jgi:hypothetical protein
MGCPSTQLSGREALAMKISADVVPMKAMRSERKGAKGGILLDILSSNEGCALMFANAPETVVVMRIWRRRVEKGAARRSVRSARVVRFQVRKGKAGRAPSIYDASRL